MNMTADSLSFKTIFVVRPQAISFSCVNNVFVIEAAERFTADPCSQNSGGFWKASDRLGELLEDSGRILEDFGRTWGGGRLDQAVQG